MPESVRVVNVGGGAQRYGSVTLQIMGFETVKAITPDPMQYVEFCSIPPDAAEREDDGESLKLESFNEVIEVTVKASRRGQERGDEIPFGDGFAFDVAEVGGRKERIRVEGTEEDIPELDTVREDDVAERKVLFAEKFGEVGKEEPRYESPEDCWGSDALVKGNLNSNSESRGM